MFHASGCTLVLEISPPVVICPDSCLQLDIFLLNGQFPLPAYKIHWISGFSELSGNFKQLNLKAIKLSDCLNIAKHSVKYIKLFQDLLNGHK